MASSPQSIGGRIGSLTMWSRVADRTARTAAARAASMSKFERETREDPAFADATEAQILAAAAARRKAHFVKMAYKSARARARRS